jgi:hypothetical protein
VSVLRGLGHRGEHRHRGKDGQEPGNSLAGYSLCEFLTQVVCLSANMAELIPVSRGFPREGGLFRTRSECGLDCHPKISRLPLPREGRRIYQDQTLASANFIQMHSYPHQVVSGGSTGVTWLSTN